MSTEQAQEFAESLGMPWLETSAKLSVNVDETFTQMAKAIKERLGQASEDKGAVDSVKVVSHKPKKKGGFKCSI